MMNKFFKLAFTATPEFWREDKPMQSFYLEFIRSRTQEILDLGEFEALRRYLRSNMEVSPQESHRITREFYKELRKEQKSK
jgi:superfamily II DNA or RNA helicase